MNSKERVIRAIEFDQPDRIPHMHSYRFATFDKYGEDFAKLLQEYPSDFHQGPALRETLEGSDRGTAIDEWGVTWVKLQDGYMGQPKGHPLDTWEKLGEYQVPSPDPDSSVFLRHHTRQREVSSEEKYVCMFGGNLFERLQWLRGMRNVVLDLMCGRKELLRLADRIVEYNIGLARHWCEAGCDGVVFSDDWGTQDRLMIRPELWRSIFKPRYAKMFREVKRTGARVHFHSDGYILDIVPDMIDLGIDVLNPQLNVHRVSELHRLCGGRLCIRGGLDRQVTLPRGSRTEVREHVMNAIRHFAPYDGGWIACGELGPDVPLSNCEEMMRSFFIYGKYAS